MTTQRGSSLNRRGFLGMAATATLATGCGTLGRPGEAPFPIIDTHTHFYDPTRSQGVPWPPANDPLLYRAVLPAEYIRIAQPLGITGTVVVEASPWLEDNQWILDLAAKESWIVGFVGNLDPSSEDFARHLKRFATNPLFRGIRVGGNSLVKHADNSLFQRNLRALADADLSLDLLGGRDMLGAAVKLASAEPTLRIIIDHVAGARIDGRAPATEWVEAMRAAGSSPNIACKVSGLVEGTGKSNGDAPSEVEFYRPVLDIVWSIFGPDRVIYGSNWPVSARFAPLGTVHEIVASYVRSWPLIEQKKFFSGNAARFYRWKKR